MDVRPRLESSAGSNDSVDPPGHSTTRLYVPLEFRVRIEIVARSRSGLFSRHPSLEVGGFVHLPELRIDFVFCREDRSDLDSESARASAAVVPSGFRVAIPRQPIDPLSAERPDLWVRTSEPNRRPPWLEHYVGRCDQRVVTFDREVTAGATLDVSCRVDRRHPRRGHKVETWGSLSFERPMTMPLLLRDSAQTGTRAERHEVTMLAAGTRVAVERQAVSAPPGAPPWNAVRVRDRGGRLLNPEHALGIPQAFW